MNANQETPDWYDPDDQELVTTPKDVVDALGFDPKEFSETSEDK